jgi:hypothetical protein
MKELSLTKLEVFMKKNGICKKKLCGMIDIRPDRLEELLFGSSPTPKEKHQLKVLEKFTHYSNKGFDYSSEIEHQESVLENLDKTLYSELERIDSENQEIIVNIANAIKIEGMYLGMYYADDCKGNLVEEQVREVRNGK